MKKIISVITVICMLMCTLTVFSSAENSADHVIMLLSDENADGSYSCVAEIDGEKITEYDYTWHADPSQVHDDVEDVPGVYFTGTEPSGDEAVYIAHDIIYYPELDKEGFKKINYDGETEWAYYYTAGEYSDYIFSTLPVLGDSLPEDMMHSEEEAYKNAVLHITEAGTYEIKGTWHGQIKIDLGDEAFDDENAKVTLILSGADITCSVAPAIVFGSVYECDNEWEDRETYSAQVDTSYAGANVILTKDSINNISGANIFRLLKAKYKSDENESSSDIRVQKKYIKNDAAFYSYMSMNIDGEGTLNITSTYEGLDTELHLSINGGNINIYSQDDGINVNEDNVSVLSINGGTTHIYAGLGSEGDGIDSNGYLSINGGTLITTANPRSDSGLDSSCGSYIYGGTVVALGSTMDGVEEPSDGNGQVSANFRFSSMQNSDEAIIITDADDNIVFAYDPGKDPVANGNERTYQGAIISSPELKQGETYHVYIGGDALGSSDNGIYTAENATGYTAEAAKQSYTGTMGGFGMGGKGNGPMRDEMNGERPDRPTGESMTPPEMPSGENGEPNNGMRGERPERPDGESGRPGAQNVAEGEASTEFVMNSVVNNFSGVSDFNETQTEKPSFFKRILNKIAEFFRNIGEFFRKLFTGELFKK